MGDKKLAELVDAVRELLAVYHGTTMHKKVCIIWNRVDRAVKPFIPKRKKKVKRTEK